MKTVIVPDLIRFKEKSEKAKNQRHILKLNDRIAELEKQNDVYRHVLEDTNELLSRLEDYTHGKDGVDITMARGHINKALNSKDNEI